MERSEVERQVRLARAYAAEELPWLAPGLFSARLVLTEGCPSLAAVDNRLCVYFNPGLVEKLIAAAPDALTVAKELAWVWVHEISHVLREHGDRARDIHAEKLRWNIAADLEINDANWVGLQPPTTYPPLHPRQFSLPEGQLAEIYYKQIPAIKKRFGDQCFAGSAWNEGSGVHGEVEPWELPEESEGEANPGLSDMEKEALRQQIAEAVIKEKSRGTIPLGWLRWAESLNVSRVNWRDLLQRRVRSAIAIGTGQRLDYSMQRPNRRGATFKPFLRPSLQGQQQPRVVCIVDTSGSIGTQELSQSLAEVRAVLDGLRVPITVIPCDAVAYEPIKVFTQSDFLRLRSGMKGGGGTDMRAGIDAALKLRPDAVIVLTDGFTPFPSHPCRIPVLFGILVASRHGSQVCKPPIPPWREEDVIVIRLHDGV